MNNLRRMVSLGVFILSSALVSPVAQATPLEAIGDNMARKMDVTWRNDGFVYTLRNIPVQNIGAGKTLNLNGARARAYTTPPLNAPLQTFGVVYDGKDILQGVGAIGVFFGLANSCQGFDSHSLGNSMEGFISKVQQQGSYTLNTTLNGAPFKLSGTKSGAGVYHLDISMSYPKGTPLKCSFSKYAKLPIPTTGDFKTLPATGAVDGPRQATPAEAQEAQRYARRLTGKGCTNPIVIRDYAFDGPLNAQQRRVVVQDSHKEIAQTFKEKGKTYDTHYNYDTSEAWGVTTEPRKNTFTLSRTSSNGKFHQLLCQLKD